VLLGDWAAEWWQSTANLRPSTRARDESLLRNHVLPAFGDAPLAAIGQRDVRAWVAALAASDLAAAAVAKIYQTLSRVLGGAVDAGMIPASPCRRVALPRIERQEMRFLTPAQVDVLAVTIDSRYRALVVLAAYGGLRIGELAGLRRRRVDLVAGTVEVVEIVTEVRGTLMIGPPKTRASRRSIGLPRFAIAELADALAGRDGRDGFVFPAPEGGPLRVVGFRSRVWRPGPGTPRSASRWTVTVICFPKPTWRCGIGWTPCMTHSYRLLAARAH